MKPKYTKLSDFDGVEGPVPATIGGGTGESSKQEELEELDEFSEFSDDTRAKAKKDEPPVVVYKTAQEQRHVIVIAVIFYAFCSSTLLVINKVAMHLMPTASFVLLCQFVSSVIAVLGLRAMKPDMDIESLKWDKVKPFSAAAAVFYMCLLANTKALGSVNVEAVIVIRSCSPIAVAVLDHLALGRELPSRKGCFALIGIVCGAVVYVAADEGVRIGGYLWLAVYFVFIVIEMVFVKFVIEKVQMSTWTRVYYNNLLSIPMALASAVITNDRAFLTVKWTVPSVCAVALSCIVGVGISYAGFNLRKLISATSFTVVGVVCKMFTVLINDLIWSYHSNVLGHVGLCICIAAGILYERAKTEQHQTTAAAA